MQSLEELIDEIGRSVSRAEQLEKLYQKFLDEAEEFLDSNSKPLGVTYVREDNSLYVSVLDREVRFSYTASFKDASKGIVTVNELSLSHPEEADLGKFSFNGEGRTDIESKDPNDPYYLQSDRTVATIISHWLAQALKVK